MSGSVSLVFWLQSDGELCVESVSGGDSQDSGQASDDDNQGNVIPISNKYCYFT